MTPIKQHIETGTYPVTWPGNLINGAWIAGSKSADESASVNPNREVDLLRFSTDKDCLGEAITAAETGFGSLRRLSLEKRLCNLKQMWEAFENNRDTLVRCLEIEIGKPNWEAIIEVNAACDYLRRLTEHGSQIQTQLLAPATIANGSRADFSLSPVGITVAYLPFATPVTSFASIFAGAMLASCPLLLVSSTQASLCALQFAYMTKNLDLPDGVLSVIFGGFKHFKIALGDHRVKAAIYTGSKEHCDQLRKQHKGFRNRQIILQSGGKNAALVHSTADISKAVKGTFFGAFRSAGQLCSSTSRVFVFRSQLSEFIEKLSLALQQMTIGPTDLTASQNEMGPMMGPLYSRKSVEKFLLFQTMAERETEENVSRGREIHLKPGSGYFVSPGVRLMKEFSSTSSYQSNTLFCPDLAIYAYDDLDEAIAKINTAETCLSMAFFGDKNMIQERQSLFHAPNISVDAPTTELDANLPLAGRSLNGHHRYHGSALALYLSYPQALRDCESDWSCVNSWPWPNS